VPRYVVLRHETPPGYRQGLHWDLMLEEGERLLTWALEKEPEPGSAIAATKLPDHRLAYLDYEGPVSGERGRVTRVASGEFTWLTRDENAVAVVLHVDTQHVRLDLRRESGERWIASLNVERLTQ